MIQGILQQPESTLLTTTNVTDILSMSAGDSRSALTLSRWKIVNRDSTDRKVTLWWHDGTTAYTIFEGVVGANSTMWDDDVNILLFAKQTAKKIQAQAAAANVVTVTLITTTTPQQTPNAGNPGSGR